MENASWLIDVTLVGFLIDSKFEQPENAESPIVVTFAQIALLITLFCLKTSNGFRILGKKDALD